MNKNAQKKQRLIFLALFIAMGLCIIGNKNQALANSDTQDTSFSATVQSKCNINGPASISFGSYAPVETNAASPDDSAGSINITCNKGGSGVIALGNGNNFSSPNRRLKNGTSNYLIYDLYTTSDRSASWNSSNTKSFGPAPANGAITATVYARIPAGQDVVAGNYTDSVLMTVTY